MEWFQPICLRCHHCLAHLQLHLCRFQSMETGSQHPHHLYSRKETQNRRPEFAECHSSGALCPEGKSENTRWWPCHPTLSTNLYVVQWRSLSFFNSRMPSILSGLNVQRRGSAGANCHEQGYMIVIWILTWFCRRTASESANCSWEHFLPISVQTNQKSRGGKWNRAGMLTKIDKFFSWNKQRTMFDICLSSSKYQAANSGLQPHFVSKMTFCLRLWLRRQFEAVPE